MKKIGFIGVGAMGKPMAHNLLKAGLPLTVCDIVKEPVDELVGSGAVAARIPKEVAEVSEVIILMVADTPDVQQVLLGEKGVVEGVREGSTIIVMSTIEPLAMRNMAQAVAKAKRGVKVLDAPVTKGVAAAREGTLSIMVGGEKGAFEDCREILQVMGQDIFYCGEIGAGQVVKMVNNYIAINSELLMAEAMVLGVKCGVSADRLFEVIVTGAAGSWILEKMWGPRVLKGDFAPTFRLNLAYKDIGIAMATARELGVPVPVGAVCFQTFQAARAAGKGELDTVAAVTLLEELTGVKVRGEIGEGSG